MIRNKVIALAIALTLFPTVANAKVYHIVKTPKATRSLTSVGKYGYTYHRESTIKCPFFGCRRAYTH